MENQNQEQKHSLANIRGQVFPLLEIGLKKLLQELNKNEALPKYQAELIQKKIYDRCQKKYIDRELLKRQLGDQYQSSDSQGEGDYELIEDMSRTTMHKLIRGKLISNNFDPEMLEEVQQTQRTQKYLDEELEQINEQQNEDDKIVESKFNPILYLAKQMERAYKQGKPPR